MARRVAKSKKKPMILMRRPWAMSVRLRRRQSSAMQPVASQPGADLCVTSWCVRL